MVLVPRLFKATGPHPQREAPFMSVSVTTAPTLTDIETLARQAIAELPPVFLAELADVAVHVVDFPDDDTLEDMGAEDDYSLLGLYTGHGLDRKATHHAPQAVNTIHLYRRPILDYWCETGEDLGHVVRHVIVHEIGHHLGFSDDDMDAIELDV